MKFACLFRKYSSQVPLDQRVDAIIESGKFLHNDARQLFDQMLDQVPTPPIISFNLLLGAFAKAKHYDDVALLYKKMDSSSRIKPDIFSMNVLINSYSETSTDREVYMVIGNMLKRGFSPDVVTLNCLMKSLCMNLKMERNMDEACVVLKKMLALHCGPDCAPNTVTFNTLILGLCKAGRSKEGLKVLKLMLSEFNIQPDNRTFSSVINGLGKEGFIMVATETFALMIEFGILPNVITYGTFINLLCRGGYVKEGRNLLMFMIEKGIVPNNKVYTPVIRKLCDLRKVDEAVCVFEMVQKLDLPIYNTMIDGYVLAGLVDKATEMLDIMSSKGIEPNVVTYNIIIKGNCRYKNNIWKALSCYTKMLAKGIEPTSVTYTSLLKGFFDLGETFIAKKLFKEMQSFGVEDPIPYNVYVDGLCKNGLIKEAVDFCGSMKFSSLRTYTSLIDACWKQGLSEDAWSTFQDMKSQGGIKPVLITYSVMIAGLSQNGEIKKALDMLCEMEADGCAPNRIIMKTLSVAFSRDENSEKVVQLLPQFQEYLKRFPL